MIPSCNDPHVKDLPPIPSLLVLRPKHPRERSFQAWSSSWRRWEHIFDSKLQECLLFWIRARLGQLRVVAEWENPPVSVCLFLSGFQNQRKDLFSKMKHLPMINLTQWNFLKTLKSETDWDTGPNPRDISAFKKVCFQICLGSCLPLHRRQRACAHYQRVLSCKFQFLDLIFYS